ncbi:MAG: pyridoxamine kinase [Acetatifactor sp.]|nr:pyridoxamine kinase [Acetatifactor sp.]
MSKRVLLLNDLPGFGKVALAEAIPILSYMGYEVCSLPTALVSNTLDLGKFHILDTTDYLKKAVNVWEELGITFDGILTGFLASKEQTGFLTEYCMKQSKRGTKIFVDPIMGDYGKLYNGMTGETVNQMRRLISVADYILPNETEAAYLAGMEQYLDSSLQGNYQEIIERLREHGAKSVVITSARGSASGGRAVVGFDHRQNKYFQLDYEEIPGKFPGAGDIFSAVLMGKVLSGVSFTEAVQASMDTVRRMIDLFGENNSRYKGFPLERYLNVLDES